MSELVAQQAVIGGYRIAHGVHGKGMPVVLVHGTPSYSHIWRNVVPVLTGAGLKVHLFDLLGYGHSERPRDPAADTSVSGQVPILKALMKEWGLHRAHIVAHDIGGAVAMRFSIFNPAMVASLTVIDTVSFDSWPSPRTRQQIAEGLETLIRKPDAEHRAHFREWILTTVHNPDRLQREALDNYVDMISGPIGQASLFQHQIAHYDHRHTSELDGRLAELGDLPVQIVWGEQDRWQVVDWAHRLNAAIPGSKLHVLPDCGHFAMEDKPQEIAELISAFVHAA